MEIFNKTRSRKSTIQIQSTIQSRNKPRTNQIKNRAKNKDILKNLSNYIKSSILGQTKD